jgi:hypothetical protein
MSGRSNYADSDWVWLSDISWFEKLPKYKQSQLWNFVFHRLNDLCMLLWHDDLVFPKIRSVGVRVIAERNGKSVDSISPETIGTGFKPAGWEKQVFVGCSGVYWAPVLLSCYDVFQGRKPMVELPKWAVRELKSIKP